MLNSSWPSNQEDVLSTMAQQKGQKVCGSSCNLLPKNRAPEAVALLTLPHPGPSQVSRKSTAGSSLAYQRRLEFRPGNSKGHWRLPSTALQFPAEESQSQREDGPPSSPQVDLFP